MQYLLTPQQMRGLDAHMIHDQHVPGIVLMEHAAMGVVHAVLEHMPQAGAGEALIFCGSGNNGGDGLAILRQLRISGRAARAILLCDPETLQGDARLQYDMAVGCGLRLEVALTEEAVDAIPFSDAAVVVDALFGTGLVREVAGRHLHAIQAINCSGLPVIAVDIPSGVDGATGKVFGEAVRACCTVTFQHKKLGQLLLPGRSYVGELRVVPIGLPALLEYDAVELEEMDVRKLLPERPIESHKGKNGRALLCAGSGIYAGAALLCATAALRAGCGLLYAAVPQGIRDMFSVCPGAICLPMGESAIWSDEAAREAIAQLGGKDAIAIGPGMGDGEGIATLLEHALRTRMPLVIDADGLQALARNRALCQLLHKDVILTPHPGEMGRLLGLDTQAITDDPLRYARQTAREWGCIVLLKGSTSIIAMASEKDERVQTCLNITGNTGLAKGGSGDVLTGILLALCAQGLPAFEAACAGAFLLGASAQKAMHLLGTRMLLPTDVAQAIACVDLFGNAGQ